MRRYFTAAIGTVALLLCGFRSADADWVEGRRTYVNPDTGVESSGASGIKISLLGGGGSQIIGTQGLSLGSATVAPSQLGYANGLALTSRGRQYWVWQNGDAYVVDTTVAIFRNITGSTAVTPGTAGHAESQSLDLTDNTGAHYPHQYARPTASDDANPVYSKFILNRTFHVGEVFYASVLLYAESDCSRGIKPPLMGDSNATSRAWAGLTISSYTIGP